MKRSELKKIIKRIVEECIKDALLTSGLLTSVISEVVAGVQKGMITETKVQTPPPQEEQEDHQKALSEAERMRILENKKKLLDAIGTSAYNNVDVFEGTKPIKKAGSPSSGSGGYSPFEGVDPSDPGVDISSLANTAGRNWKRLAEGKK